MQDITSSIAARKDKILGMFLKDVADFLAKPVSALWNISVSQLD